MRLLLGGSTAAVGGFSVIGSLRRGAGATAGSDGVTLSAGSPATGAPAGAATAGATGPATSSTSSTIASVVTAANNCPLPNTLRPVSDAEDCPNNRVPKQNHTPATNGCGPQAGVDFVPDDFGDYSFTGPCNGHDVCYGTCGSSKAQCDDQFFDDMVEVCQNTTFALSSDRSACIRNATIYATAVASFADGAYADGQVEGCDCCEPPVEACVFCNCNDTYYPQAEIATCLDECHVSLGCFTGICGPAVCP